MSNYLYVLDWRRRVADLFGELRRRPATAATAAWFRAAKDDLFRTHPASPLPESRRAEFGGLPHWPHDPAGRVVARFTPADAEDAAVPISRDDKAMAFSRIGDLDFELFGTPLRLGAFWVHGYAGGLFVPLRDGTSGRETYGGGRYLLDTIKSADFGSTSPGSADLGSSGPGSTEVGSSSPGMTDPERRELADADSGADLASATVVLDFNYAYHPSCAYDPRWACPLTPPENHLPLPIRLGERLARDEDGA